MARNLASMARRCSRVGGGHIGPHSSTRNSPVAGHGPSGGGTGTRRATCTPQAATPATGEFRVE
ncbi:hypothetical protein C1I98_25640, partial [Spongiactinospora gelatinilytica]